MVRTQFMTSSSVMRPTPNSPVSRAHTHQTRGNGWLITVFTPCPCVCSFRFWPHALTSLLRNNIEKSAHKNHSNWRTLFVLRMQHKWEHTTNRYSMLSKISVAKVRVTFYLATLDFVCNHLATTKRKECNPKTTTTTKTELLKIITKNKNENIFYKTNKIQLKLV